MENRHDEPDHPGGGTNSLGDLNRPERLNALDSALAMELREFFIGLYSRQDIRVLVLSGAGHGFCAGLDLKDVAPSDANPTITELLIRQHAVTEIIVAIRRCPQPIIGLINWPESGGGFALALASGARLANPTARMNSAPRPATSA